MATYSHEKVLADYARGDMDVEMAMGHSLQHIGHLYTAQSAATAERQALRKQVVTLEQTIGALQGEVTGLQQVVTTLQSAFERAVARTKTAQLQAKATSPREDRTADG